MGKSFAQYTRDTMGKAASAAVKIVDKAGVTNAVGALNGANRDIDNANVAGSIADAKFQKVKVLNDAKKAQMATQAKMDKEAIAAKKSTYKRQGGDANWEGRGGR